MPNTPKSNKLKRKRGKKFVFRGNAQAGAPSSSTPTENPFDEHIKTKRAKKDLDKREELLAEFRRLNKTSVIKDQRIGESATSKLTEEDKMKLRYIREQRD